MTNKKYKNKYRKNYGGKLSWVGNDRELILSWLAGVSDVNQPNTNINTESADVSKRP